MKRKIIVFYIMILGLLLLFNASCSCKMTPSIYYLNFKTEQDAAWQKIAKEYEKQKGVKVNVVTAASGNYEATLTSELNKTNAPTLFQINGEIGYNTWKEYILDLSNEEVTQELISEDYAIIEDGKTYGIGYVYEGYGIIVNKKLLNKTPYKIDDIVSLEKLKEVTEYITKNKDSLNFSAFTSPGLDSSSSWRFTGHLLNIPLYYEFKDRVVISQPQTVDGRYLSSYKALWELYINNSTVEPNKLSSKTSTDSLSDFILEKACFYQNGTWEYENIKTIGDENIGFIPIYAGVLTDMGILLLSHQGDKRCLGMNRLCPHSPLMRAEHQQRKDLGIAHTRSVKEHKSEQQVIYPEAVHDSNAHTLGTHMNHRATESIGHTLDKRNIPVSGAIPIGKGVTDDLNFLVPITLTHFKVFLVFLPVSKPFTDFS